MCVLTREKVRDRLMTRLDLSLSLAGKCGKGVADFAGDGSRKGHTAPPSVLRVALLQDIFLVREILHMYSTIVLISNHKSRAG